MVLLPSHLCREDPSERRPDLILCSLTRQRCPLPSPEETSSGFEPNIKARIWPWQDTVTELDWREEKTRKVEEQLAVTTRQAEQVRALPSTLRVGSNRLTRSPFYHKCIYHYIHIYTYVHRLTAAGRVVGGDRGSQSGEGHRGSNLAKKAKPAASLG
jgi:hypothetical protein